MDITLTYENQFCVIGITFGSSPYHETKHTPVSLILWGWLLDSCIEDQI